MFEWLFKRSKNSAPLATYATPQRECAYVIGDIHGCLDALTSLLDKIEARARDIHPELKTTLVFLGDYIDRGPDSAGVIAHLLQYKPADMRTVFLKGNHEDVFLAILGGDSEQMKSWFRFGGKACARSYGVDNLGDISFAPDNVFYQLLASVPSDHIDFLKACDTHFIFGDYICVHAGLKPKVAIVDQRPTDMMWIREEFLKHKGAFPLKVVHGHTVVEAGENRDNRIAVDTGAYKPDGQLTAAYLEGETVAFVSTSNANKTII